MKKIVFAFLISFLLIANAWAFDINIDKIDINEKSNELINGLNKTYNIEISDFKNTIVSNKEVEAYVKELVKLSFSNSSDVDKLNTLKSKYLFIDPSNGFNTLNGNMFIEMYLNDIKNQEIKSNYLRKIVTVEFNENDLLSFVYLPNSSVNGEKMDVVATYWLKNINGNYKLYYPYITTGEDLDDYYKSVITNEEKGELGGTYNKLSLSGNSVSVSSPELKQLYANNKYSSVQITGMSDTGSNMYGSGFYIREGVIVTTWSLLLKFLTNSNYIYVNDVLGNVYEVDGLVSASTKYDVAILKLKKETGKPVVLGDANKLQTDDKLFLINSKNNSHFTISYGSFIKNTNGKLENLFVLSSEDIGGALYNKKGEVVAFAVGDSINSELSYANSTTYLDKFQKILKNQNFSSIKITKLNDFKENYYKLVSEEKVYNDIKEKKWNKYKKVGNIEENITLKLLKANIKDNIVSLRYQNDASNLLDSLYLVSNYTAELENEGFELSYKDDNKMIYKNKKYEVIIKNSLNYLLIVITEN